MGLKREIAANLMVNEIPLPITAGELLEMTSEQYNILFPTATLLPGTIFLLKHSQILQIFVG